MPSSGAPFLAQPGAKAWQIFDSQTLHLLEARYSTSDPIVADTLEDLVDLLDIEDKARAIRTLKAFNEGRARRGRGFRSDQEGRPRNPWRSEAAQVELGAASR